MQHWKEKEGAKLVVTRRARQKKKFVRACFVTSSRKGRKKKKEKKTLGEVIDYWEKNRGLPCVEKRTEQVGNGMWFF